jgi:hypothetical protein
VPSTPRRNWKGLASHNIASNKYEGDLQRGLTEPGLLHPIVSINDSHEERKNGRFTFVSNGKIHDVYPMIYPIVNP